MPYFFYFLIFSSYFPFTFLLLIFFFYFSFPFLISTASRPSPVAYLFASSQPQRTHTRPPASRIQLQRRRRPDLGPPLLCAVAVHQVSPCSAIAVLLSSALLFNTGDKGLRID
jgi:hypothetical protein